MRGRDVCMSEIWRNFFLSFSLSLDFPFALLVVRILCESSEAVTWVHWIMESVESEAGNQVRLIEGKKPNIQGEHLLWWLHVDLVVCLKAQTAQSYYKMSHGKSLTNLKLNRVICSWFAAVGRAYVDHCANHWTSTVRLTVVILLHKQIPFTSLPLFSETIVRFWTVEITSSCMDCGWQMMRVTERGDKD